MGNIAELSKKIRQNESPFYRLLYKWAKRVKYFEMPYIPGFHDVLYHERNLRINFWRNFWRISYYQPLFRSRCCQCGEKLHISHSGQGLPYLQGDLQIFLGDSVELYDRITLAALTVGEKPKLIIGDNTSISQTIAILVGNEVEIGSNCMIGASLISDNPGHNMDFRERHQKIRKEKIGKVKIGNYVWAALQSIIVGNVTIGDGAIIGARTVVRENVPPFCLVLGDPAKIVKKLTFPEELREQIGEEQYENYKAVQLE